MTAEDKVWRLCSVCSEVDQRWLDTKPSTLIPRISLTFGSGTPYDSSRAGLMDSRRARFEEWRATVQHSREMLKVSCRAGHHGA